MNTRAIGRGSACLLAIGLVWLAPAGFVGAQDKSEERKIVFKPRGLSWPATLEWLTDASGLPIVASGAPTGTFTYVHSGPDRKYTLGEVIDILNEGLAAKSYILIRREKAIALLPADQSLDPALVPRITIAELDKRGKTEIVSIVVPLKTLVADEFAPELKRMLSKFGNVVVLGRANQLVVTDSADNLRRVIDTIQKIEEPDNKRKKSPAAAGILRTYQVPAGQAERLAKLVQEIFKNSPSVRVSAIGTNSIVVFATAEDHIALAQHLEENAARVNTALFQLHALDAARVADTLRGMFGDVKAGGPFIDADAIRNSLIVRGSAEQVQEIKSVLRLLGESDQPGNTRSFMLDRGGAETLADALEKLLTQMRDNPVKVILPIRPPVGAARPKPAAKEESSKKEPRLVKGQAPIVITAVANRLMVTCDEPEVLALVAELIRLMQTPAAEGDFEVVRLKHAQSNNVARVLDEAFNTGRVAKGPFGGGGGPAMPRNERIRVVADPATNSLLIKASPLDTLTIRSLLTRALDVPEARNAPDEGATPPAGFPGAAPEFRLPMKKRFSPK